ncbi:hypothetical protein Lser_V15G34680 [Lactuca serriola]
MIPPPPRTPVRFRHATLFGDWENPSTLFRIQERTLLDLSFWKIDEDNQPIDIGRPNGFFQCIISGSNGIHRYRKRLSMGCLYDHISIVNTIYKDRYSKEYYTLDREISIVMEPWNCSENGILQIRSQKFYKSDSGGKNVNDPTGIELG